MPPHTDLAFKYGDPENYERPMSIAVARKQGFTEFSFYPTAREAAEWAERLEDMTGRKTVTFNEVLNIAGQKIVVHVLGETPRPRPVVKVALPQSHSKLNAFASFMGEWAAKLKRVISR